MADPDECTASRTDCPEYLRESDTCLPQGEPRPLKGCSFSTGQSEVNTLMSMVNALSVSNSSHETQAHLLRF